MRSARFRRHSLPVQMVVTLVSLVVLTAAAIGVPAIWLLWGQLDRLAGEMLAQGGRTAQALISEQQSRLINLAILTGQRPTLQALVGKGDRDELGDYLDELRWGAGLDLLIVCGPDQRPFLQSGAAIETSLCRLAATPGLFFSDEGDGWLLAAQPLEDGLQEYRVVVGRALDDDFARQLRDQTGLEVVLLLENRHLADSFPVEAGADAELASFFETSPSDEQAHQRITLNRTPFYFARSEIPETGLNLLLFFPAGGIARAQRELTWLAGMGIFLVVAVSSGLGILRARQISRPLGRLRDAAAALRQGDLETPVNVRTNVREAAQVAHALEEARRALQHSLAQLHKEKAWVEYLLEAVVEGILTIDRRGRITFFSQGAERITGWKGDQVFGKSVDEVLQGREENFPFSQQLPEAGGRQKIVVRLRNGRQATLAVTRAHLKAPEAGRASEILVLRDISDEEVLRRLLGEFLANVSHEFRTPLTALAASVELLLEQLGDLTPDELHELLNSIHLGVLNLQTLIDNLLEGASIETGRFRVFPRPTDLGEIIQEAVHTMSPLADKYGQTIQVDLPGTLLPVQSDYRRTVQVLVNLLSNAIKWGPSGGIITLSAVREAGQILVCVADEGPGIPEGDQVDLFHRFDRIQEREDRGESGAGLGLSVVKAIVEAQGGQVGARNRAGRGADFWFTIPALQTEPAGVEPQP